MVCYLLSGTCGTMIGYRATLGGSRGGLKMWTSYF